MTTIEHQRELTPIGPQHFKYFARISRRGDGLVVAIRRPVLEALGYDPDEARFDPWVDAGWRLGDRHEPWPICFYENEFGALRLAQENRYSYNRKEKGPWLLKIQGESRIGGIPLFGPEMVRVKREGGFLKIAWPKFKNPPIQKRRVQKTIVTTDSVSTQANEESIMTAIETGETTETGEVIELLRSAVPSNGKSIPHNHPEIDCLFPGCAYDNYFKCIRDIYDVEAAVMWVSLCARPQVVFLRDPSDSSGEAHDHVLISVGGPRATLDGQFKLVNSGLRRTFNSLNRVMEHLIKNPNTKRDVWLYAFVYDLLGNKIPAHALRYRVFTSSAS